MQHQLVLADKYMTLVSDRVMTIKLEDMHFFEELGVWSFLKHRMVGEEGMTVELKKEYYQTEGMVNDVAFLVESLQDVLDADALGNMIHFIAEASQSNEIEFIEQVVAKVKEYVTVEKELEYVEEEA